MKKVLSFILILLSSSTLPALAVDVPGTYNSPFSDLGQLTSALLPNVIVAAGVNFFILMILGAFGMITSAGREANPQLTAKAKAAVTYGFVGFLIVVSAYFILQLVQTATGVNLTNPKL